MAKSDSQRVETERQPAPTTPEIDEFGESTFANQEPAEDLPPPITPVEEPITAEPTTAETIPESADQSMVPDSPITPTEEDDLGFLEEPAETTPAEVFPPQEPELSDTSPLLPASRAALATWKMSSEWSMAAALQAKGMGVERYGQRLELAQEQAELLDVTLPDLPTPDDAPDLVELHLDYLLDEAGPRLAVELSEKHGPESAALAELATKSHVLLLSYVPSSTELEPVVAAIKRAAQASGLPESVWSELTKLLADQASFQDVKSAIFKLHQAATTHLAEQAGE